MEASDREDILGEWLEDHNIRDGWDLAPTFVQAGLDVEWLDQVTEAVPDDTLEGAIRWLNYTVEAELLLNEIHDSTTRISTLVGAAKQYSQLDRAPFVSVDIHELLDSTLTMLTGKIGRIKIVRDYDRSLPQIVAFAAELNQVWTNLIDNAVGAMHGEGTLTIRTPRTTTTAWSSRSATPVPGYPGTSNPGSSSRSSPPNRSARAPGWAWTSPTASWSTSTTATSR